MLPRYLQRTRLSDRPAEGAPPNFSDKISAGKVLTVYPSKHIATVEIFAGYKIGLIAPACHFLSLGRNYQSKSSIVFVPEVGDLVYLDWRFGPTPVIIGYYPLTTSDENPEGVKPTLTPIRAIGGEDEIFKNKNLEGYRPGLTDLLPGDKVIMGREGNLLGILAGGLSILKASPLAQFILNKYNDSITAISRRFRLLTDFGELNFKNESGSTSVELLGNDGDLESNKHTGNWAYAIRLGAQRFLDVNFKGLFNFWVERDGSVFVKAKRATVVMDEPPKLNFNGALHTKIGGTASRIIGADDYKEVSGTSIQKMSKSVSICSGPKNEVTSGIASIQYQSTYSERIQGTSLTSTSTVAKETLIGAGDYNISIGDPSDCGIGTPSAPLAAQLKTGNFNLKLMSGDINQTILTKGDHNTYTVLGNISHFTAAGNVELQTSLGNISCQTLSGNCEMTTLAGNIDVSTLAGDAHFGTKLGNVTIEATVGSIKLSAGASAIEIGPSGIKISNGQGSVELLDTLIKLANYLVSAQTPGYGGPLSTAANIGSEVVVNLMSIKGA